MKLATLITVVLGLGLMVGGAQGQGMDVLKEDVGVWNAEIRMFEPGSDKPTTSKGKEQNRMMGDMWLVSHFQGEMMGQPFEGASYTGYNAETKKYFGNWIDSMTPTPMAMEGTYDKASKTLTTMGTNKGPDGSDTTMKLTTSWNKDGSRLFTMSMVIPGSPDLKVMEIHYTRANDTQASEHGK